MHWGMDDVDAAMRAIDRRGFLPPDSVPWAADDRPLPIGHGQTNSQPRTVAAMLRLLDAREGQHVLDVGSGSGWTTALLARLVGPSGTVVGVELEPDLAAWGAANAWESGARNATIHEAAPGVLGWPADAPYDRILVSAAARELPEPLVAQLRAPGVMVCVVGSSLVRVALDDEGARGITRHGTYAFVPLR